AVPQAPATPEVSTPLGVQPDLPDIGLPPTEPAPAVTVPATEPGADVAAPARPASPLGQQPDAVTPAAAEQAGGAATVADLDDPQFLALAAATIQQRERDAAIDRVGASLRPLGLTEAASRSQATLLVDAGYDGPAGAVDGLAAKVSGAIAALSAGDAPAARALVAEIDTAYQASVSGLLRAVDGAVASDTESLLSSLTSRPVLREHDLALLAGQVDAVARTLAGGDQSASQALELMVDGVWSGWVRLGVFVLLGIFAFLPLRYLNMAFGGGNA